MPSPQLVENLIRDPEKWLRRSDRKVQVLEAFKAYINRLSGEFKMGERPSVGLGVNGGPSLATECRIGFSEPKNLERMQEHLTHVFGDDVRFEPRLIGGHQGFVVTGRVLENLRKIRKNDPGRYSDEGRMVAKERARRIQAHSQQDHSRA